MVKSLFFGSLLLAASARAGAASPFDRDFEPRTMRLDYFHSGTASEEHVAIDRVVADGEWAGSRTALVDESGLGLFRFEIVDPGNQQVLYSRGFSTIFGEWQSTSEAKGGWGTYHESLRFPWPKRPVQVVLKHRGADMLFREIWTTKVDPSSRAVNPAVLRPKGNVVFLEENGPAAAKVDLLLLGDGYTEAEQPKLEKDARRLLDALWREEPFRSRRKDFNVRVVNVPSAESGIARPHGKSWHRSALSLSYSIFDAERYVLGTDNRAIRDAASAVPYDAMILLVNERTYGGGGIYEWQATVAVDSGSAEYVFVHEFGHSFAGLGDEYYTSPAVYEPKAGESRPEPWEPNTTANADPATIKWKPFVDAGTAVPTAWDKKAFDEHSRGYQARRKKIRDSNADESEMDKLFAEERDWEEKFLGSQKSAGKVGAFEGANYEAFGYYRPSADCMMFTRDRVGFCRVCRAAIDEAIDRYVK